MLPPTRNQARILWIALTFLAITVILACTGALVWALGKALHLFGPVLWPLAIAAVLAYLLDPLVDLLVKRKMKRQRAIVFVFGVAVLAVLGLGAAVLPRLVFETRELAVKIPDYARQIQQRSVNLLENARGRFPFLDQRTEPSTTISTNAAPPGTEPALVPTPPDSQPEIPVGAETHAVRRLVAAQGAPAYRSVDGRSGFARGGVVRFARRHRAGPGLLLLFSPGEKRHSKKLDGLPARAGIEGERRNRFCDHGHQ